jgi:hypothetical protein
MHQVDSIGATSRIWISCLIDFEEDRCSWAEFDKGGCSLPVVRWCSICTLYPLTLRFVLGVLGVMDCCTVSTTSGCFQSLREPLVRTRTHTQLGASSTCLEAHPPPLSSVNETTQAIPDRIPRHPNVRPNEEFLLKQHASAPGSSVY